MNHRTPFLLLVVIAFICTTLSAQNTLRPRPMNEQFDATHGSLVQELGDPDIFRHNVNKFIFGGQWGNSDFRIINNALNHAVHVNASTWPSGVYSVYVRSGMTSRATLFSVVH